MAVDDRDGAAAVDCSRATDRCSPLGATVVTCTASDAAGNTATASFTVTILHSTPKVVADSFSVPEDSPGTLLDVLANDSNPDGDPVIVTGVGPASHGSTSFSSSGVTYTPAADYAGPDSFTYSASDGFGGTATGTVSVTVTGVNDAPVNAVPGPQATPVNQRLFFSQARGNPVSVGDVDAGSDPLRLALSASNGTLTLGNRSGLTFLSGDGVADATLSFTGTLASLNAALEGMSFAPRAGYTGPASLTLNTSDLGHSGAGGTRTDIDAVSISVGVWADLAVTATDSPHGVAVAPT